MILRCRQKVFDGPGYIWTNLVALHGKAQCTRCPVVISVSAWKIASGYVDTPAVGDIGCRSKQRQASLNRAYDSKSKDQIFSF
jgi:hypothetical protein